MIVSCIEYNKYCDLLASSGYPVLGTHLWNIQKTSLVWNNKIPPWLSIGMELEDIFLKQDVVLLPFKHSVFLKAKV